MKVTVDNNLLFELTPTQIQILKDDIGEDIFEEDFKRRVIYAALRRYNESFAKLKKEWDQRLAASGIDSFPTDKDEYAKLVFAQKDYQDYNDRNKE